MSFIYSDKKLLTELLKHGQGAAYTQQTTNFENMRQLLDNLEKQIAAKHEGGGTVVSHEGDPGAEVALRSENMKNLGTMVNFLATNKITVNGKRIAFSGNQDPHDDEHYQLYQLTSNGLMEAPDRSQLTQGFFADKDLLSAYLVSLQSELHQRPNRVEEVMLEKLITQSNDLLDTNINPQYKHPSDKPAHDQKGKQGPVQPGQSPQQTQPVTVDVMQLAAMQPFNSSYIAVDQLKKFTDNYAMLSNDTNAKKNASDIDRLIETANGYMTTQTSTISLDNMNSVSLGLITSQPLLLLSTLYSLVNKASDMYRQFSVEYRNAILSENDGADAYRRVQQQIQPEGPAAANIRTLTRLISDAQTQSRTRR